MVAKGQDRDSRDLCHSCGLCCDGTFFDFVEVIEERSVEKEKYSRNTRLDVEVTTTKKFSLPCSCFDKKIGCTIYNDRPRVCRNFKCGLLKQLINNKRSLKSCINIVKQLQESTACIADSLNNQASFIKPTPLLKKFYLVYGQIGDTKSMQDLGKKNASLLKFYMSFAMAYQEFFPKKKLLPLINEEHS